MRRTPALLLAATTALLLTACTDDGGGGTVTPSAGAPAFFFGVGTGMRMKTDAKKGIVSTQDHSALQMMLAYVEAECRRLGAEAAAEHAAMAAALVLNVPTIPSGPLRALH